MRPRASIVRSASSVSIMLLRSSTRSTISATDSSPACDPEGFEQPAKGCDGTKGWLREPDLVGTDERLPERHPECVRERPQPSERRIADAPPRPVGDAGERERVVRIDEQVQVGDASLISARS